MIDLTTLVMWLVKFYQFYKQNKNLFIIFYYCRLKVKINKMRIHSKVKWLNRKIITKKYITLPAASYP